MIAREFISQSVPPLKSSDTGSKALSWMSDFHVSHLPIVDNGRFVGLITEEDILNHNHPKQSLGKHPLSLQKSFISEYDHVYEVVKMAVNLQLSLLPVLDEDDNYLGSITTTSLLSYFAQSASITDPGSILVLEIPRQNYSLFEIARIVESEGVLVLSSMMTSHPNSNVVEVTLKLNAQHIEHIVATFQRFDYIIKASFQESDYLDTLQDRYDAFMSYLNV